MVDSTADGRTVRRVVTVAVVGLLVAFSGCAGLGANGPGGPDGGETTDATTDATETSAEATNGSVGTTAADGNSETTAADGSSETTASDGSGHSHDGHSHSHGNETTASDSDSANATENISGKMTVVVAGTELPLGERSGDTVSIASDDEHTWRASGNLTLAEALSSFGVEANASAVRYDGATYRESERGVSVHYRVNGETVSPASYTLRNGDQIWVTVESADANYSVPGEYIRAAQQHIHGPMEFVVEGEEVDFSAERFQSGHRHFHFEGGHANPWHAHSWSVTLQYALNTLHEINVTDDSVTYNGTTYRRGDAGTTVSIQVNGEAVDPSEYFLKDGDSVRIVVEKEEA